MNNNYNDKDIPDYDDLDDEILRDEVHRIFIKHPHDYIPRLEGLGFIYHDAMKMIKTGMDIQLPVHSIASFMEMMLPEIVPFVPLR
jgi:hypothetical protein